MSENISDDNGINRGVFYSLNASLLCSNIILRNTTHIIEPFVGKGSLLEIFPDIDTLELYDINPPNRDYNGHIITVRDTLLDPPDYSDKTILTNPPYLALNKMDDDTKNVYSALMKKLKVDDMFKIFIAQLCLNPAIECICVLPFSFLFSVRISDVNLREKFLQVYDVLHVNLFLNQIFADTTTNIAVIHGLKRAILSKSTEFSFNCSLLQTQLNPPKLLHENRITVQLRKDEKYLLGGEIYALTGKGRTERYTSKTANSMFASNLKTYCIDNITDKIRMEYAPDIIEGKHSDRTTCFIAFENKVSQERQKYIAQRFNELLGEYREKYHSLFMTNFRDKNRKRITFELVFNLVSFIAEQMEISKNALILFE